MTLLLLDEKGHIWRTGFECNELKSVVFKEVAEALEKWHSSGTKVYIYSSGSQLAQRLRFGNINYGDLRLSGHFDTTIGNKKESKSYEEITETLGVDDPSDIFLLQMFIKEATTAKAAGLEAIISIRLGNASLPDNHGLASINVTQLRNHAISMLQRSIAGADGIMLPQPLWFQCFNAAIFPLLDELLSVSIENSRITFKKTVEETLVLATKLMSKDFLLSG